MSKHTPGPWHTAEGNFIVDSNERIVAEVPCQGANDADVPFIAAAPEMYQSLRLAYGALLELSPCMATECQQIQTETLDCALKKIQALLARIDNG